MTRKRSIAVKAKEQEEGKKEMEWKEMCMYQEEMGRNKLEDEAR